MANSTPYSLALGRFKRLAQRSDETWQGGIVRMPMWIDDPDEPDADPYRPSAAFWASLRTGLIHVALASEDASPEFALATMLDFPARVRGVAARPAIIEVRDPALRDQLVASLGETGTVVRLVDRLPAVESALASFEASATDGQRVPGLLEVSGMTVERLRAFAKAAASFFAARPWRHLSNEDLIVVAAPGRRVPRGMKHLVVLGNGGQEFGIGFFASRKAFERILDAPGIPAFNRAYGVTFGPIENLPFADADVWEDLALPVAGSEAYPQPLDLSLDGSVRRPEPGELAFMEALLRGLADVTEDELDTGAWARRVRSADGELPLRFSLPLLLEAERDPAGAPRAAGPRMSERPLAQLRRFLDSQQFDTIDDANAALAAAAAGGLFDQPDELVAVRPLTPLEQAQELVYQAEDAIGRLQVKLVRRALAISPDCADAYRMLGEMAGDPDEASALYAHAVDAGARAIGEAAFDSLAGEFWGHLETRPYMRARLALASAMRAARRTDEALGHYRELLRLNPGDNQGVRYLLLPYLLQEGRDDEAGRLLDAYEGDIQATWPYARALLRFRAEGDTTAARAALAEAVDVNPHVIPYLLAPEEIPPFVPPHVSFGSPEEAAFVAEESLAAFENTPGAMAWLRSAGRRPRGRRQTRGGRGKRSRRG